MVNAVEGGCLDGGVVYHILEDDFVARLQGIVETPVAHEVTT